MDFQEFLGRVESYKESISGLAEALAEAKVRYGEMVGDGINTWHDFLAQPEVGISVREANEMIKLLELETAIGVPLTQLNLATARFAASKGIYDYDLIEDMKVLSIKDFKDRHYDTVVKEDNAPRTYKYMVMKRCVETGNLTRVYGDEVDVAVKNIEKE